MARESSRRQYFIHIPKRTGMLQKFTAYTAKKIIEFCHRRVDGDFNGNQEVIATRIAEVVES